MKHNIYLFIVFSIFAFASCDSDRSTESKTAEVTINDTIPKVTGVGGIFIESEDPKAMMDWYGKHLGLAIDAYGSPFEFRNANRPEEINYLRWSPYDSTSKISAPSSHKFVINYRVQNMEGLVRKMKLNGIEFLDTIAEYPYGKFIHLMDPEGFKIELWEPYDKFFTDMGGETTK